MKYCYIHPDVLVQQSNVEGKFVVHYHDGSTEILTEKELLAKFRPVVNDTKAEDRKREMYRLCTEIIDQEALVDDDNAEDLLADAVDLARELRKLIQ